MSDNYLGEIRLFAFEFMPHNWHICDGTLLPIREYQALYSLLGITYGGNGTSNFALPDLRGRTIMGIGRYEGSIYQRGEKGGAEKAELTKEQTSHNHLMSVEAAQGDFPIATNILAIPDVTTVTSEVINIYSTANSPNRVLNSETIEVSGSNLPHYNMQPYAVTNYCIALTGIYPPRPY